MHVFTYGSLMYEAVWSQVVRGHYRQCLAGLAGYRRWCVRGEHYPGLWPAMATDKVSGVLYFDLEAGDLARLDAFEGAYYRRQRLPCEVAGEVVEAEVYLFRSRYRQLLTTREWQAETFERQGLQPFIQRYRGFMPPQK
ncbi:gamma-glutamylcyclotransferase family protein [Motiliproteus sediminis]|uniref:gamma-glutamylcyclotransferase family protein n=1 Tax=Motiliproteus sediminis TaxID=1468178 RepID=UPI001AF0107D|nr:gamma-glutamylcyclotransferase family protein [Motiliproteus sediminis]